MHEAASERPNLRIVPKTHEQEVAEIIPTLGLNSRYQEYAGRLIRRGYLQNIVPPLAAMQEKMSIIRGKLRILNPLIDTAGHEIGHSDVGQAHGAATEISLKPEGHSLDHTTLHFVGSIKDRIQAMLASLHGGLVAERRMGINDNRGCNHDLSRVEPLSRIYSNWWGGNEGDHIRIGYDSALTTVRDRYNLIESAIDRSLQEAA